MSPPNDQGQAYICPMHADVRQPGPGKCPKCSMDLLPEGIRYALFRHIAQNRWMVVVMLVVMFAVMAMLMMK